MGKCEWKFQSSEVMAGQTVVLGIGFGKRWVLSALRKEVRLVCDFSGIERLFQTAGAAYENDRRPFSVRILGDCEKVL